MKTILTSVILLCLCSCQEHKAERMNFVADSIYADDSAKINDSAAKQQDKTFEQWRDSVRNSPHHKAAVGEK